jgi:hypothetical protein
MSFDPNAEILIVVRPEGGQFRLYPLIGGVAWQPGRLVSIVNAQTLTSAASFFSKEYLPQIGAISL